MRSVAGSWRWASWLLVALLGSLALVLVGCGGDDDDDGGSGGNDEPQLTRLADLAEADAKANGTKFQNTGFAVYCRQNSGYEGSVFEKIGFKPEGNQAKDEYCYNVSDDLLKVGVSRRSASSGKGSCLVLTIANGAVSRSEITSMGSSEGCTP